MKDFKVFIQNLLNPDLYWQAFFDTLAEAETWRDEQILKVGRNTTPGWFAENQLSPERIASATDERYTLVDANMYIKEYLVPAEATAEIFDLTEYNAKVTIKEGKRTVGKILRELSQNTLDIITGHFSTKNLTLTEIADLKVQFADAYQSLSENMPLTAKTYLDQILPDGNLVTQEILDDVNLEYSIYKENYPDIVDY